MNNKIKIATAVLIVSAGAWIVQAQDNYPQNDNRPQPGQRGPGPRNGGQQQQQQGQPDGQQGPGGPGQRGPGPKGPPPAIIRALDLNHDGIIDADEIAKASESLRTLDKNGDRQLTPDEFIGMPPHRPGGPGPDGQGQRGPGQGEFRGGPGPGQNGQGQRGPGPGPGAPARGGNQGGVPAGE